MEQRIIKIKRFSKKEKKDSIRDAAFIGSGIGAISALGGAISDQMLIHSLPKKTDKIAEKAGATAIANPVNPKSHFMFLGGDKKILEKEIKKLKRKHSINKALMIGGVGTAIGGTGLATYRNIKNGD